MAMPSGNAINTFSLKLDLWWQFTVRAVEMKHRGSYLGVIWTVLNPLLMLGLYVSVFSLVFRSHFNENESPVDYALAVFIGLILYHTASETIAAAPSYIVTHPNLVKKVVFPLQLLPIANASALWFHFLISFVLLIVASLVVHRPPALTGLALMPLILAPQIMLTLGVSMILSALGVFFRDISQVVGFVATVVLWTSGVFLSPAMIMSRAPLVWEILKWNPMLLTIDLSRKALLWHQPVAWSDLAFTWIAGTVVLALGVVVFRKLQPAFADVL